MQCPKCGLVLSDLDEECLRCKRRGEGASVSAATVLSTSVEEKECPRCGKATFLSATTCDKCGYEYHPDSSRAERYQALVAQEPDLPSPSGLRKPLPPALSYGIIAACLLVIGGAGWGMFGGTSAESTSQDVIEAPVIMSRHHKPAHGPVLQTVTYSVTGTASHARVIYEDANEVSISPPSAVSLPWMETIKAKPGTHLSISAAPSGQSGTATVAIQAGDTLLKQAAQPGTDGLTKAEATLQNPPSSQ